MVSILLTPASFSAELPAHTPESLLWYLSHLCCLRGITLDSSHSLTPYRDHQKSLSLTPKIWLKVFHFSPSLLLPLGTRSLQLLTKLLLLPSYFFFWFPTSLLHIRTINLIILLPCLKPFSGAPLYLE